MPTTLLQQIATFSRHPQPLVSLLSDVLEHPGRPVSEVTLSAMIGLSLGTVSNRIGVTSEGGMTFMDYGLNNEFRRECERLTHHPLIPAYTKCIVTLSFLEWDAILKSKWRSDGQ